LITLMASVHGSVTRRQFNAYLSQMCGSNGLTCAKVTIVAQPAVSLLMCSARVKSINMILGEPSDTWGYSVEHTTDITLEKVLGNFTIRNEKQQKYPDFQEKYDFDKFGAVLVELQKDSFFEDIKSTINAMLKYNASERITTQQLLNRRWMVQIDTPDEEYLGQIPPAGEGSDFESGQHFV